MTDTVTVATCEPFVLSWIAEVQNATGKKVQLVVSSSSAIRHFIEEFCTVRVATQEFRRENPRSKLFERTIELDQMLGAPPHVQGDAVGLDHTVLSNHRQLRSPS